MKFARFTFSCTVGCASDGSSGDFSRMSLRNGSSEYSLTASHSSRSRSSHDSSSSRVWDFSPRESEWDVQQGGTSSSSSVRQGGGPSTAAGTAGTGGSQVDVGTSLLAPSIPRPGGPQLNSVGQKQSIFLSLRTFCIGSALLQLLVNGLPSDMRCLAGVINNDE